MTGGASGRRTPTPADEVVSAGRDALAENPPRTVPLQLRVAIEQAFARGCTVDDICVRLRVAVETVDRVFERMTALAHYDTDPHLEPCGTHAAFNRHKANGEPVDDDCRAGERAYQAERGRARRRRRAAA